MKIAFTGTHGTGKTTACYALAQLMKVEHPDKTVTVLAENASRSPYPINRGTTVESQLWIFTNQMREELELSARYDIVICDRSVCDAIAYSFVAGFSGLGNAMIDLAVRHISSYDRIIARLIKYHDHWKDDGIRDAKDADFRRRVEECLVNVYKKIDEKAREAGGKLQLEFDDGKADD